VSFFVATDIWTWVALVGSLLFLLAVEFLNTAIERLCNHVQPEKHAAIRVTKDLGSAAVFFAILLAALVWIAALLARFGFWCLRVVRDDYRNRQLEAPRRGTDHQGQRGAAREEASARGDDAHPQRGAHPSRYARPSLAPDRRDRRL